jgi:hypothetical protein
MAFSTEWLAKIVQPGSGILQPGHSTPNLVNAWNGRFLAISYNLWLGRSGSAGLVRQFDMCSRGALSETRARNGNLAFRHLYNPSPARSSTATEAVSTARASAASSGRIAFSISSIAAPCTAIRRAITRRS